MLSFVLKPNLLIIKCKCLLNFWNLLFIIVFLLSTHLGLAQKPVLDTSVFKEWPKIESGKISNDGQYVSYRIIYSGYGDVVREELVIQPVSGRWKRVLPSVTSDIVFSSDSKKAFIKLTNDTLAIFSLHNNDVNYIPDAISYQIYQNYLFYQLRTSPTLLHVQMLANNRQFSIENVNSYLVNESNASLIVVSEKNHAASLSMFDLKREKRVTFWEGSEPSAFTFDAVSGNMAFIGKANEIKGVWIYMSKENKIRKVIEENNPAFDSTLEIRELRWFSPKDHRLFLVLEKKHIPSPKKSDLLKADVSIWSYSDVTLKSQSYFIGLPHSDYIYIIDLKSDKVSPVTLNNESIYDLNGNYAILKQFSGAGNPEEYYWNPASQIKFLLISLHDGQRKELLIEEPLLSRGGKYVLYFDQHTNDYYTYETSSGKIVNLTESITKKTRLPFVKYNSEFVRSLGYRSYWTDNDSNVIIYAQRDIWLLDPKGVRPARNITNGYGARWNVIFHSIQDWSEFKFENNEPIIVMGFNQTTKDNGFYKIYWNKNKEPQQLIMDGHVYYMPRASIENGNESDNRPIKAKYANKWLIRRMSERESPNYFITSDFKTYKPVTSLYPERKFNWLSTELHTWKKYDGDSAQGVLYKPENFNPGKRYPIIVHFYNQFSYNLHAYFEPQVAGGPINIPWYVSHGYLVFEPDVSYKIGETGKSAYNAVVSAAEYLKTLPCVDSTKMGIQGHSFGGYQTNYIITQTNIFTAACSSSGVTDIISFAGLLGASGNSNHYMSSEGQLGLGLRLWDSTDIYIKNSPLFYLKKVFTPLLAMHTTADQAVPFSQAMELFNGLRQFRKKVWLLIYEGENHVLRKEKNALDYTIRQKQFFDYYLNNMKEPDWMRANAN